MFFPDHHEREPWEALSAIRDSSVAPEATVKMHLDGPVELRFYTTEVVAAAAIARRYGGRLMDADDTMITTAEENQ